ncbi:hypothetical protein [Bifidobacterium platyrrhinorum]|nr:hypothetical protein [Bifidobacterium platyrrhinorum]
MTTEPTVQPQGDSLPPDNIQPMSELESEQALTAAEGAADEGEAA